MKLRSLMALILCVLLAHAAELPVRTVVLYKHGVGFFERGGTLGAGESARLGFNAGGMNDVVKSLTLGTSGGKGTGFRPAFMDPPSRKPRAFPLPTSGGRVPGTPVVIKGR